jgi:cytoplasmic iron level regulating protein YaaA (DUF328/UPF0246 family)
MYEASPLFRESYRLAEQDGGPIAILSAKYGLLPPDQEIEPYELSLRDLGDADRQAWGARVLQQLDALTGGHVREIVFLAGRDYRDVLTPYLHARGISTRVHPRWRAITAAAFGAQATDPVSQSYENSAVSLTSE